MRNVKILYVLGMNVLEVGDVVAVVIHRRREEGGQGHGPHPKVLEIVQLGLNTCNNIPIVMFKVRGRRRAGNRPSLHNTRSFCVSIVRQIL